MLPLHNRRLSFPIIFSHTLKCYLTFLLLCANCAEGYYLPVAEAAREDVPVEAEVSGQVVHSLDPIVQQQPRQFLTVHHETV